MGKYGRDGIDRVVEFTGGSGEEVGESLVMRSRRFRSLFVALVFFFFGYGVRGTEGSQCTESRVYDRELKKYVDQNISCSSGCCGTYPNQQCCQISIGIVAGSVVAAVTLFALLALLVCCCVKKYGNSSHRGGVQRAAGADVEAEGGVDLRMSYPPHHRPRTPHWTNINFIYGGPCQYPGFAWGRPRRVTPIKPPPYAAQDSSPPPYSLLHPTQSFCLPGQSWDDALPTSLPGAETTFSTPGPSRRGAEDVAPGIVDHLQGDSSVPDAPLPSGDRLSGHDPPPEQSSQGDSSSSAGTAPAGVPPAASRVLEEEEAPPSYTPPLPGSLVSYPAGCQSGFPGGGDLGMGGDYLPREDFPPGHLHYGPGVVPDSDTFEDSEDDSEGQGYGS